METFSACSCFYSILPGDKTEVYYLAYQLIFFYIVILIIGEGKEFHGLMQIFGLHPIVNWTARLIFDIFLTLVYSFILYLISTLHSENDPLEKVAPAMINLDYLQREMNTQVTKKFYLFNLILAFTTLPFLYLLTSK